MGQSFSFYCYFFFPEYIFKNKNLIYDGKNSTVYKLPSKRYICKVVSNYNMFLHEKDFICFMKNKKHENIIQYYHIIPSRYMYFLVETASTDLLQWIKQNYMKSTYKRELKTFLKQFANGYRFLLQHHIEHYDLKPDNLLLVNNTLKIADFGTSQINMEQYVLNTGTFGFIAPEIVGITNNNYYIQHSMDVYSTCIMLAYIYFKSVCIEFYKRKKWTLKHYLSLEKYTHDFYPSSFIKNGLIVDQRYRMTMDKLLSHLEKE